MTVKTTDRLIRILSLLVGVIGIAIVAALSLEIYRQVFSFFASENPPATFDGLFTLFFITPFLALGLFAIHTAIKAWTRLTASLIHRLAAIGAVVVWGVLANSLQYLPPHEQTLSEPVYFAITGSILLVLAVLFYTYVSRWLIARSSFSHKPPSPASPSLVAMFCFFIWVDLSTLAEQLVPKESGYTSVPKEPWGIVGLLTSFLIAVLLYKTILHLSARRIKRYKQSHLSTSSPA